MKTKDIELPGDEDQDASQVEGGCPAHLCEEISQESDGVRSPIRETLSRNAFSLAVLSLLLVVTVAVAISPHRWVRPLRSDAFEHAVGFLLLAVVLTALWPGLKARRILMLLAPLGVFIEIAQYLAQTGHHAQFTDWLADMAGAATGLILVAMARREPKQVQSPAKPADGEAVSASVSDNASEKRSAN